MKTLNSKIIAKIHEKTGLAISTIGPSITRRKQLNPSFTPNAVAFLYAQEKNVNVLKFLDAEDKACIHAIEKKPVEKIQVKTGKKNDTKKIVKLINFDSSDPFIKGHVEEVNKAYTYGCYTSAVILSRKIVENLIIDIFTKYFPPSTKENKELYFDTSKKRNKDFGEILENLHTKRVDFDTKKEIVERLYDKAKSLKGNANSKTHSWFHLVKRQKEVDDLEIQTVIDLIQRLLV